MTTFITEFYDKDDDDDDESVGTSSHDSRCTNGLCRF